MRSASGRKMTPINRKLIIHSTLCVMVVCVLLPGLAFCQNAFEAAFSDKLNALLTADSTKNPKHPIFPNDVAGNIMTPSGFGGRNK